MAKKNYEEGTKKIHATDMNEYVFLNKNWMVSKQTSDNIKKIIQKYLTKENINLILDDIYNKFIKGHLNQHGQVSGSRIRHLPTGKELAKGGFSIFAKNLTFNKNKRYLWDVSYENTSGLKTYLYSIDKIHLEKKKKAKIVDEFIEEYPNIIKKLEKDLKKTKKNKYLALYTMLHTYIRVGNLHHYKHLKHKVLTTLEKKDIKINNDNTCEFKFIGKDGVPQHIKKEFPEFYIKILKSKLEKLKNNEFVFTDEKTNLPLHSSDFSDILYRYTKKHFYPHIIRSFYADLTCKRFIDENKRKKLKRKHVNDCFLEIAANLGHKKYNKETKDWEVNFKITLDNYIRPKLVERMKKLYSKK